MVQCMRSGHFSSGEDAALYAKCFGKRPGFEVDLSLKIELSHNSRSLLTKNAFTMTIVDVDHGSILFGQGSHLIKWSNIAIH